MLVAQHMLQLQKEQQKTDAQSPSEAEDMQEQERRLLEQFALSPPSETLISEEGDQITVHHPREEPKKSKLKLRDFFVAEFGIYKLYFVYLPHYTEKNYMEFVHFIVFNTVAVPRSNLSCKLYK